MKTFPAHCIRKDQVTLFLTKLVADLQLDSDQAVAARKCLSAGEAILAVREDDSVIGGIGFQYAPMLDQVGYCMIERLLYVLPMYRGGTAAHRLIRAFEAEAVTRQCKAVFAGASILGSKEVARRLYEGAGYDVNYTFRKDL